MIDEPGGMRLADAREVIAHDYYANEPSPALVYAARRVLIELDRRGGPEPLPVELRRMRCAHPAQHFAHTMHTGRDWVGLCMGEAP